MYRRNRIIVSTIAFAMVVGLGVRVIPVLAKGAGNLHQEIHWILYGYDRVWYHNRTYLGPGRELTAEETEKTYGQGQKFIPTGDKVIGLPVYDTPRSLAFQKQRQVVSTLLFLKKPNGDFIVYELSGGP